METSIPPGRIGSARANAKTDESRLQSFGKPRVGRAAGPNAGRPDWSRTPDNPERHLRALALIRHVALDMDGTIYSGQSLFKETAPFLSLLHEHGVGHSFLTNNSSKSAADHVKHLHSLGVAAKPEELFTSAHAAFEYLRETRPEIRRLFVLGTESMRQEIAAAGFALTADDSADEPDAVLAGFDTALVFARLCRAAWWIKQGKPFFASHPDRVCPTDEPTVLVDCGSICAALKQATGREPNAVLGKPEARMLRGLLRHHRLQPQDRMMVGDHLYTDMEMARRTGTLAVLVLTGETTLEDLPFHGRQSDRGAVRLPRGAQLAVVFPRAGHHRVGKFAFSVAAAARHARVGRVAGS